MTEYQFIDAEAEVIAFRTHHAISVELEALLSEADAAQYERAVDRHPGKQRVESAVAFNNQEAAAKRDAAESFHTLAGTSLADVAHGLIPPVEERLTLMEGAVARQQDIVDNAVAYDADLEGASWVLTHLQCGLEVLAELHARIVELL